MALPEEFEVILKEAVNTKRLSASKMTSLTEIAMKNMEHDTQLVSILYRNHKSLPTAAAKISSLYIFDALARAARHHATKHGLSGDVFTHPGNSASFLFKMGGVVEGLFQDMKAIRSPESKEKTKKILDIWVKGNTFPPTILSQLSDIIKDVEKVPDPKPPAILTVDPRTPNQVFSSAPAPTVQSPFIGLDPQAALLALLTQAAASSGSLPQMGVPQIATNTGTPQLDAMASQLAVIQQLAHTAASVPPISQSLTPAESVNVQNFPSSSGVIGSSHNLLPFRNEPRTMVKSEQRYSGYRSPESESRLDPHFDERDNVRGRYRGGYRNRGHGDKFHGRDWDARDRDRYRNTDRDQSPARRGGRSRSRSPPSKYGEWQAPRYFSPPRRQQVASQYAVGRDLPTSRVNISGLKDEFGRDIRPGSISPPPSVANDKSPSIPPNQSTIARSPTPSKSPRSPFALAVTSKFDRSPPDQNPVSPLVTANTSSSKTSAPSIVNSMAVGRGMDAFDLSTFDYTSPASWEALGKMWQVTHGYLPTTEQLMQFVISSGTGQSVDITEQSLQTNRSSSVRGEGRNQGQPSGGRGETAYGHSRDMLQDSVDDNENMSRADATIGGGGSPKQGGRDAGNQPTVAKYDPPTSGSGRMQRIGDKWVFVRGVAMDVS